MVPHIANLSIAPGVGPQRNPAAVMDSSEMSRFLQDVKARFDFIIFDAAPLTSRNDAFLLESQTDGMVIVARPGVTQRPALTTLLEQLEDKEEIRVLGAVVNDVNVPLAEAQQREDAFARGGDELTTTQPSSKPSVPVRIPVDF